MSSHVERFMHLTFKDKYEALNDLYDKSVKLYDLIKDKVEYDGVACLQECPYLDGKNDKCKAFLDCAKTEVDEQMRAIYNTRCQVCIDMFGGVE